MVLKRGQGALHVIEESRPKDREGLGENFVQGLQGVPTLVFGRKGTSLADFIAPQAIGDNPPGLWNNQQRNLSEDVWGADKQASTRFRDNFVAGLGIIPSGLWLIFALLRGTKT